MKKGLGLIFLTFFGVSASATSLHPDTFKKFLRSYTCASQAGYAKDGFGVDVLMQGEVWQNQNDFEMDWNGYFKILSSVESGVNLSADLWAFKANAQDNLVYDSKYKPRKYVDHIRFNVDFRENAGTTQFIVPRDALVRTENPQTSPFVAYLVMSHIQDHFGTTVPLDCF